MEEYTGYSAVNIDSKGRYHLDQAVIGEGEEKYIIMSRPVKDLLEEERDKANLLLARAEADYF